MSSPDDLEGDDIWGDGASGGTTGNTTTTSGDESKQQETDENNATTTNDDVVMEDEETRHMTISELRQRIHLLSSDIRVMKSDVQRITHESRGQRERILENLEKVKVNKQLPYLVANVVEILEPDAEDGKYSKRLCVAFNCDYLLLKENETSILILIRYRQLF
jgi:ATP-dependent 26S proteasome regulatory subunit